MANCLCKFGIIATKTKNATCIIYIRGFMYLILTTTFLVNMRHKHIPHLYQHTARPIADTQSSFNMSQKPIFAPLDFFCDHWVQISNAFLWEICSQRLMSKSGWAKMGFGDMLGGIQGGGSRGGSRGVTMVNMTKNVGDVENVWEKGISHWFLFLRTSFARCAKNQPYFWLIVQNWCTMSQK